MWWSHSRQLKHGEESYPQPEGSGSEYSGAVSVVKPAGWTEGDWPRAVVFAGRFVRSRSNSAAGARLMETVHDHKTAATTVHVTRTLVFNTVASLQIMHPEVQLTPPGGTNSHRIGARRPARLHIYFCVPASSY